MNRATRQQPPELVESAGVIGVATMASRVLGLVRDQVLAYFFGAGDAMDAFRIAFRLPSVLRDLFAEGALSAALVPTFTRALAEDRLRTWRVVSNVIGVLTVVSAIVVVLGMLLAGPLADLYAAGFRQIPGKLELTVRLTRIMFPFVVLVGVAAVMMALLNALHHFFVPALSPATFNVAMIACAGAGVPLALRTGIDPVLAIAAGTLVGGLGQILLQWPAAAREGFRYEPVFDLKDPWLREAGRLLVPGVVGLAAVQINLFINSWLASGLGTGAVSWLDYAFRLMYMPIGLFGISIATASLPGISGYAAVNDHHGLRHTVSGALRMVLMLNIPATVGLLVLATPIVSLIFERGRFTSLDTAETAAALACYAPGLLGYSAVKLLTPVFYAMGNSRVPVAASAVSIGMNIALNLVLVRSLGHRGLALGTATAALVNAGLLFALLRARLGGLDGGRIAAASMKILVASLAMAIAAHYTERLMGIPFPGTGLAPQAIRVLGAIVLGMAVLGVSAHFLRIGEFEQLRRRFL